MKIHGVTTSQYILQVNKNKFLNAEDPDHMVGRRINEGSISGIPYNARFGASLRSYVCKNTGRHYKSVFTTRNIRPEEEILVYYGR